VARTYGAKTDQHRFPVVNNMTAAFSIGAWVRRTSDNTFDTIYCRITSGGVVTFALEIAEVDTLEFETSGAKNSTATVVAADGWVFIGVDKATGSVTPRCHIWKQASGWTHQNFGGSLANPGTATGGTVRIGEYTGGTEDNFSGDIEVVVEFNGVQLTDAQWESVAFSRAGMLAKHPTGLWELRQASVEQKVPDLSGTGMNESVRAGTTVATRSCPFYFTDGGPIYTPAITAGGKALTLEITDSVSLADAIGKGTGKAIVDTAALSDSVSRSTAKAITDSTTLSDAVGRTVGKGISDSVGLADSLRLGVGKVLADSATVVDAVAKNIGHTETDAVALADSIAKKPGVSISDSVSLSDSIGRTVRKALADAVSLADSISLEPMRMIVPDLPVTLVLAAASGLLRLAPASWRTSLAKRRDTLSAAEASSDLALEPPNPATDLAKADTSLDVEDEDSETELKLDA
jgi:hypothetical protein